ncbi:unnamed protein product [Leptidea sinapis]|uniref:Uncharacterized protein n=1 Tax=Leptidea sinapis TaxID=189913 RepID=A0A5E4Q5F0_9NEOP|nr:unnamed protein product [Leptidea sinapis]
MRSFVVLCLCASGCIVMGQDIEAMKNMPKYDSRYDYLDVDALFNSKRLVRNYVDCLINGLRCTPEGKALKTTSQHFIRVTEVFDAECSTINHRQDAKEVAIYARLRLDLHVSIFNYPYIVEQEMKSPLVIQNPESIFLS